jgi:hypothetical protein
LFPMSLHLALGLKLERFQLRAQCLVLFLDPHSLRYSLFPPLFASEPYQLLLLDACWK